jgi:hypothetical protein
VQSGKEGAWEIFEKMNLGNNENVSRDSEIAVGKGNTSIDEVDSK